MWGSLVNSGVWGPLVNSSKQCMRAFVNSTYGPIVNSAVWAPRGARTHGVAPILDPLVYVLNTDVVLEFHLSFLHSAYCSWFQPYLCDELGFDAHEHSMLFSIFTRQFLIVFLLSFPWVKIYVLFQEYILMQSEAEKWVFPWVHCTANFIYTF